MQQLKIHAYKSFVNNLCTKKVKKERVFLACPLHCWGPERAFGGIGGTIIILSFKTAFEFDQIKAKWRS